MSATIIMYLYFSSSRIHGNQSHFDIDMSTIYMLEVITFSQKIVYWKRLVFDLIIVCIRRHGYQCNMLAAVNDLFISCQVPSRCLRPAECLFRHYLIVCPRRPFCDRFEIQ